MELERNNENVNFFFTVPRSEVMITRISWASLFEDLLTGE